MLTLYNALVYVYISFMLYNNIIILKRCCIMNEEMKIEAKEIEALLKIGLSKKRIFELIFGKLITDIFSKDFDKEKSKNDLEQAIELIKKYDLAKLRDEE